MVQFPGSLDKTLTPCLAPSKKRFFFFTCWAWQRAAEGLHPCEKQPQDVTTRSVTFLKCSLMFEPSFHFVCFSLLWWVCDSPNIPPPATDKHFIFPFYAHTKSINKDRRLQQQEILFLIQTALTDWDSRSNEYRVQGSRYQMSSLQ